MKRNYGLQVLPRDEQDFKLGAIDDLPALEDLPESFRLPFIVKNQGQTDWCSAYASCSVSEVQEGVELEPAYSFAASKEISGNVESWGQDLRSACKAHVKYGGLEKTKAGDLAKGTREEKRHFSYWQDKTTEAEEHLKKSFFAISGQYDTFDNIRASLVKYNTPIMVGIQFGYKSTDILFNEIKKGTGHAMVIIGYTKYDDGQTVLIIGNSYGEEAGDNGVHYITRDVINYWVDIYGAFTFIDMDKETALYNLENGIKTGDNYLVQMIKVFLTVIKRLKNYIYGII